MIERYLTPYFDTILLVRLSTGVVQGVNVRASPFDECRPEQEEPANSRHQA
jgi:hypothetical protein